MSGEGPIVIVQIILSFLIIFTQVRLPFWGPEHIQKLKKIGVRTGTGDKFDKIAHFRGFIFGNAHCEEGAQG